MLAITCDKCRRRFTPTVEEMQGYLASQQGKKHTLVICPHCGKGNKVGVQRLQQALKFVLPLPEQEATAESTTDVADDATATAAAAATAAATTAADQPAEPAAG